MKKKLRLEEAQVLATRIINELKPFCEKIEVAGSIRRVVPVVGDIEIVCIPKTKTELRMTEGTLFPEEVSVEVNLLFDKLDKTPFKERVKNGDRFKQFIMRNGMQLDLFITNKKDYGRILAIRTGSSKYSQSILAKKWVKMGWVGTADGLRRKEQCEKTSAWKCISPNPILPPDFTTEEKFYEFLRLTWAHPFTRSI